MFHVIILSTHCLYFLLKGRFQQKIEMGANSVLLEMEHDWLSFRYDIPEQFCRSSPIHSCTQCVNVGTVNSFTESFTFWFVSILTIS